jgi:CMP-N-acetylneuraminic acid synthetase
MAESTKVLAIIPARGGSKGVPRKNVRLVCGKPLIAYTIETALAAKHLFYRIVVSTDDEEIAAIARQYGAEVPFMRPDELAGDTVPMVPVAQHAVRFIEQQDDIVMDWVSILQPTDPFRTVEDLEFGLELGLAGGCDSVISVVQVFATHPILMKRVEDNRLYPFNIEELEGTRRQDYQPAAYIRNGAVYLTRRDVLIEQDSIWGTVSRPYIMSAERSVSVDSELDLKLVEVLMREHILTP